MLRTSRVRIGVGAGVVLLLVGLVVAVLVTTFVPRGGIREVEGASASGVDFGSPSTPPGEGGYGVETGAPPLLVHVLGAVQRPGIVELGAGSRVLDAIAAAGGLVDDADPAGVNLARPVSDGEQLVVPRVGEAPSPAAVGGAVGGSGGVGGGGVVNLNLASAGELATLPRIGPALAQRIVDWREENGRFAAPSDLLKVSGIGQKLFDGLKALIAV